MEQRAARSFPSAQEIVQAISRTLLLARNEQWGFAALTQIWELPFPTFVDSVMLLPRDLFESNKYSCMRPRGSYSVGFGDLVQVIFAETAKIQSPVQTSP
nr:hypothetical protein CFP56_25892 [Quercus suber]